MSADRYLSAAPVLSISIRFEDPVPHIGAVVLHEGEWVRLRDWIESKPGLRRLVALAREIQEEAA